MLSQMRPVLVFTVFFTILTGLVYPLIVTGIAGVVFPHQASGSILEEGGETLGSEVIGQPFDDSRYFWSRPSATAPQPYNGAASSGSNLGPTNPALEEAVRGRIEVLRAADVENHDRVPVDLVTASGSGLDPHITPAAAYYQVRRVARVRGLDEMRVRRLVVEHVEPRTLGLFGEPRVNVLRLNLALDALGD